MLPGKPLLSSKCYNLVNITILFLRVYGAIHIKSDTFFSKNNFTPGYISEKLKNTNSKRCMHPNLHNSTIYNSQDMETT